MPVMIWQSSPFAGFAAMAICQHLFRKTYMSSGLSRRDQQRSMA